MRHGSLFSGIGGFDLAAEWMGWENVFHCEREPFAQKVLKYHFPNSKLYDDITTFDATDYAGRIDILTGGFPCQPFSAAGKRQGTEDERHLWPQMLRIIREIKPSYVVGENVRGLINWSGGLVFEEVCSDLEAEGYEVLPLLLPAAAVNAPHRRDRIWFVAHRNTDLDIGNTQREIQKGKDTDPNRSRSSMEGFDGDASDTENSRRRRGSSKECEERRKGVLSGKQKRGEMGSEVKGCSGKRDAPDTDIKLSERGDDNRKDGRSKQTERIKSFSKPRGWEEFPTQPPICGGNDGLPKELDGITFPKWRKESIKAYGNAIVPQVAYEIFKAINKIK